VRRQRQHYRRWSQIVYQQRLFEAGSRNMTVNCKQCQNKLRKHLSSGIPKVVRGCFRAPTHIGVESNKLHRQMRIQLCGKICASKRLLLRNLNTSTSERCERAGLCRYYATSTTVNAPGDDSVRVHPSRQPSLTRIKVKSSIPFRASTRNNRAPFSKDIRKGNGKSRLQR
jgi:hypothetical protein